MRVSILMPTYNDDLYIAAAIQSVLNQTYSNWELLIMDDGSTDNTASIVQSFTDSRIRFFQQSNQGQLKALSNLGDHITGNVVMMLHSDDLLYTNFVLEQNIKYFDNPAIDGLYCSIVQFYSNGESDKQVVNANALTRKAPKKLLTLLGSNFIPNPFFLRKECFFKNVKYNYLTWNYPYWLDFKDKKVASLKLQYSEFPWYYYRIYSENYGNSIIGNFETFLGRMRSIYLLSSYYSLPLPKIQKELARRFNLVGCVLSKQASKRKVANLLKILIQNMQGRTPGAYTWYHEQLLSFYSKNSSDTIELKSPIESAYYGLDGRRFFNDIIHNNLPDVYKELISQFRNGFCAVRVNSDKEKQSLEIILKFLCVRATVIISRL